MKKKKQKKTSGPGPSDSQEWRDRAGPPRPNVVRWVGVAATAILLAIGFVLIRRQRERPQVTVPAAAQYVGSTACASCHQDATARWQKSQHSQAMQEATEQNVLANFDNARFAYAGVTSRFYRRGGKFFVQTDGPGGRLAEFPVRYTFGVYPLQQYLLAFPDGRLQALSIAWDARPRTQGGQRWFHLYSGDRVTHTDELHWTRPSQNWNYMCADCHSTAVRKKYDPASNGFQTRWAEISVGCEACHGPGSRHLEWASASRGNKTVGSDSTKGLTVALTERRGVTWHATPPTFAVRSRPRTTEREIEVCAQCHSRRTQVADGYEPGRRFLDFYLPALLTPPLYHADGQQRGEVYNWGSFLQSRMYGAGVTCGDCHDPHSGATRARGNAVCTTCHLPSKYDAWVHHRHSTTNAGAACTSCHMPVQSYMQVDPRHDHSFKVPRPDLSAQNGSPNACTTCHSDRSYAWAAAQVRDWHGKNRRPPHQSPIVRATALAGLPPDTAAGVASALRDTNALVRLGALQALSQLPSYMRLSASALLSDPVRSVRIEAASMLAAAVNVLSPETRDAFEQAATEFIAAQRYNGDRAEARVNLGTFYAERGDTASAEREMKAAISLEPLFLPAYVNLADVYRVTGRNADGETLLRQGLALAPGSAVLHHALGLTLVRVNRSRDALESFRRAVSLAPTNARFAYVYAVALYSTGKQNEAIATLNRALDQHPNDRDIRAALESFGVRTDPQPRPRRRR